MSIERTGLVAFHGNGLTLVGNPVKVGDKAPDFSLLATDLSPRTLADFKGKTLLISVVPSLDTGICDLQTRRFNQEAAALGPDVTILTVSCDLPFAQARWCGAAGVDKLQTLSDHRDLSFGLAYGLVIKELRLLARTVLVVNRAGVISYIRIEPEMTHEPDYAAALTALRAAV